MDLKLMWESLPFLLKGAVMTLKIAVLAGLIGIALGTLIGLGRTSGRRWLSRVLGIYIDVLRGTPLLTQLLLVVFGIPQVLGVNLDEFTMGVVTFGMNSSAYVAEIIRAGIESIDRGQMEAARSIGMSRSAAMRYIILPQAFTRVIPPLVNESITLVKESSLVAAIALVELTRSAQIIVSRTYKPFPVYLAAAVVYLVITTTLARVATVLERRAARD